MARCMKASGKMICNMAGASKPGLTRVDMKATMLTEESMESEVISGMMVVSTRVTGGKIK